MNPDDPKLDKSSISVVADSETDTGFRLGGIKEVYTVKNSEEAKEIIKNLTNEGVSIIITTEKIGDEIRDFIDLTTKNRTLPIIVEVPDKTGPIKRAAPPALRTRRRRRALRAQPHPAPRPQDPARRRRDRRRQRGARRQGGRQRGDHPRGPVVVGSNTILYCKGGDIVVGTGVSFSANCQVASVRRVEVGAETVVGSFSYFLSGGEYDPASPVPFARQSGQHEARPLRIGANCWIGAHVTVTDRGEIGEHCVVGAGAVVTAPLPPNSVAVGIPARVVRSL